MCVEVCVCAAQTWPAGAAGVAGGARSASCHPPAYPPRTLTTTPLHIFDDDNILAVIPPFTKSCLIVPALPYLIFCLVTV